MSHKVWRGALFGATICGASFAQQPQQQPQHSQQPDVLFIFVDDLTFDGVNALGNKELITPNIDKIVESGTSFSNTFIMGGWNEAVSIASRTQLITGSYLWNAYEGEDTKFASNMEQESMWPQVMDNAGYKTFMTGKWHMTHIGPTMLFDEVSNPRGGMPRSVSSAYNRPVEGVEDPWSPWDKSIGGFWNGGKHWSEVLADVSIEFIEENRDSEQPLFMFCSFNAPHDPRQAPQEYVEMYDLDGIEMPANFIPEHPLKSEMGAGKGLRDEYLAPFPRTEYAVKRHRQEYYAIITHLDHQIGKIVSALKKSGRYDNTLIVFAADNGLAVGSHGLLGKQSMYEHSVKVPLVFSGLNIPKGVKRKQLVYMQDLVPTIYDIVDVERPEGMEFISQYESIVSRRAKARDYVYGAYVDHQRMVRSDRYKLYFIPKAKTVYLFDIVRDPLEMKDLYGEPRYREIVKELAREYLILAEECGDELDLKDTYPEVFED